MSESPDTLPAGAPGMRALPVSAEIFAYSQEDREQLRRLLLAHPSIDVTRTPATVGEIGWATTRLLFCDLDGRADEVLERLAERPPSVDIILSASDAQWAAAAFEMDALDFLLKPITRERLGRSIRRLLRLDWSAKEAQLAPATNRVFVPFERGRRLVAPEEICAIHAVGNYTQVLLPGGATEIVLRSLRRWEETLAPGTFLRIHRSTLANAGRIRKIEMVPSGDGALAELDGLSEKLAVSRRCLATVRAALSAVYPRPGDRSSDLGR